MIPRIPVHDEDEDGAGPTPLWRRPRFLLVVAIAIIVVVYVFTRGQEPQKRPNGQKTADTFIGEVAAYEPPARIITPAHAEDAPTPTPAPAPARPAQPVAVPPPPPVERPPAPPAPSPRAVMPQQFAQPPAPTRTRMLVYALPPIAPPAPAPAEPPETGLDFKTSAIAGLKASAAIDDTYQLMPGLLPLVLDTAINSDVPGSILAHLPGPVYSPKGVMLMEAGTQVIGRYESMGKGSRLMVNSVYAHTPKGIWVPLTAQGMADDLGRSGLDGEVDRHLMQRFGAAVLLDLTGQGLQIVQAEASKGGNTYLNLNSGGGVSSLAGSVSVRANPI